MSILWFFLVSQESVVPMLYNSQCLHYNFCCIEIHWHSNSWSNTLLFHSHCHLDIEHILCRCSLVAYLLWRHLKSGQLFGEIWNEMFSLLPTSQKRFDLLIHLPGIVNLWYFLHIGGSRKKIVSYSLHSVRLKGLHWESLLHEPLDVCNKQRQRSMRCSIFLEDSLLILMS